MSRRLPNLNALRAFEAAARNLSFSRAADELHVTQGAISRHIKALEQHLGVSLFRRLPRALELTDDGRKYLSGATEAFDRIEQAGAQIIGSAGHRVLTVNVLPTFAMRWLIPRLIHFTDAYPNVEVRMITSIRAVNFSTEDIDIAIRVGELPQTASKREGPRIDLQMVESWRQVRAAFLMPDIMIPVCSSRYLEQMGKPSSAEDLRRYTLLHNATRPHAWPDWLKGMGVASSGMPEGLSFGHFFMALQAAAEGRGIALIPRLLAEDDIRAGRVVVPLELPLESAGAYYLLCRSHQWNADLVRCFREWLLHEIEQDRALSPQPAATMNADTERRAAQS